MAGLKRYLWIPEVLSSKAPLEGPFMLLRCVFLTLQTSQSEKKPLRF